MKIAAVLSAAFLFVVFTGCLEPDYPLDPAQNDTNNEASDTNTSPTGLVDTLVETACGQCEFGMKESGCDLAVRIDGVSYFVDGSNIDDHGDAHAENGLCNCTREAKVSGEIVGDRFVATQFELLAEDH